MNNKIQSIARYNSAREILDDFCGAEFWDGINDEDEIFLNHFDDFEGFTYYAIDDAIYVTDFLGDVMYSCPDFNDFLEHVMDWLNDDRKERE